MAEAASTTKGTARSLVDDIRSILAEDVEPVETEMSVEEAALAEAEERTGKSLEKKAREKRKERGKKGGGGHNPFKSKSSLGPGPRSGSNSQTKKWKCSCSTPYKCLCKNRKTGGTKTIRIKRAYKKDYNHEYKAWRKKQEF